MAASEKLYLIATGPSTTLYSTMLEENIYLVKFSSTDMVITYFTHFKFEQKRI